MYGPTIISWRLSVHSGSDYDRGRVYTTLIFPFCVNIQREILLFAQEMIEILDLLCCGLRFLCPPIPPKV